MYNSFGRECTIVLVENVPANVTSDSDPTFLTSESLCSILCKFWSRIVVMARSSFSNSIVINLESGMDEDANAAFY